MTENPIAELMIVPDTILCEMHDEGDACDVIVRMEDGSLFTALFATLSYVHRQMDLTWMVTESIPDTAPVRYAVLDTPHIIVDALQRAIIEDTIDNLVAQGVFESLFTRVTEDEEDHQRTSSDGERATQEIAAAVIEEVLVVIGED